MIRLAVHRLQITTMFVLRGLLVMGLVASADMPALATSSFQRTGSLNVARGAYTATLLQNGEVLVAGEVMLTVIFSRAPHYITHRQGSGPLRAV